MSRVFRGKSSHTQKQHAMISVSQRYIACKSCSSCKFHAAPLPSPTPLGQHLSPRGVPSLWALRGVTEWHTRRRFEIRTSQLSTFSSNHSKIQQVKSSHHLRSPAYFLRRDLRRILPRRSFTSQGLLLTDLAIIFHQKDQPAIKSCLKPMTKTFKNVDSL